MTSGNAALTTAEAQPNGVRTNTRPASHSTAIRASLAPTGVGRPVQLRTAVKRNPATTAMVNPKSISCACHSGPAPYGTANQPAYRAVQTATDDAAKMLASK